MRSSILISFAPVDDRPNLEAELRLEPQQACVRAVELACLSPEADANPRVGCVIVGRDGNLLAEGYHRGAGTRHAEAAALHAAAEAGMDVAGATAYVTLEPCAHQGRTPSCARALITAGVAQVVYGQSDPNGEASGGATLLRDAGISAATDSDLAQASLALNSDWTFSVMHHRPRVRWKFASTLDGFSAALDGTSQWITGAAARADVHSWRASHAAIMVGTGTALADDPHLTTRSPEGELAERQPLRVVVGTRELPPTSRILDGAAKTLLLPRSEPESILAQLHARDIHSVWLEGGPTLAAAFLAADLIDEIVAYLAPSFLGAGMPAAADFGAETLAHIRRFELRDVATIITPATKDEPERADMRVVLARQDPSTSPKEH